jgi:hypothetical protein
MQLCALFMNWGRHSVKSCYTKALLHCKKLDSSGKPPSIAGVHKKLAHSPILFKECAEVIDQVVIDQGFTNRSKNSQWNGVLLTEQN